MLNKLELRDTHKIYNSYLWYKLINLRDLKIPTILTFFLPVVFIFHNYDILQLTLYLTIVTFFRKKFAIIFWLLILWWKQVSISSALTSTRFPPDSVFDQWVWDKALHSCLDAFLSLWSSNRMPDVLLTCCVCVWPFSHR